MTSTIDTLRYALLANGLLVVVCIAYYGLLRRQTFFHANRLALWLGLTASLTLPLATLPDWRPEPVRAVMQRTAAVLIPRVLPAPLAPSAEVTITFPNGRTYPAFARRSVSTGWSWQQGLLWVYLLVATVLLLQFTIRLSSLLRLIDRSEHEPYDDFTLVRNSGVSSPFSFFRWVVLNPAGYSQDQFEQIIRHERVHVRGWHSIDMVLAELVRIVFWFNPGAHLFRQFIRETLEFSADRGVLAEGVDPKSYQYNLVRVSLATGNLALTNQFSQSSLRYRIGMINRERSGQLDYGRYVLWAVLMGGMVFACQHRETPDEGTTKPHALAATSSTRAMVVALEDKRNWYMHLALYQTRFGTQMVQSEPIVLQLVNDRFRIGEDHLYESAVYIDGKEAPIEALARLTPEHVSEAFVMHKWEHQPDADPKLKPYQILIQTSPTPVKFSHERGAFFTLLQAAAISKHPGGESFMFTMNSLLEATFFHNRNALVERTKNEHLKVYDEFKDNVEVYVNRLPATVADVETIHVREVARLYVKERPYTDWFRTNSSNKRFVLLIHTAPKRAKRDSSYYVFSPFYSGDF
jgi:beta-lactamase regulating signal transducer with metallopeptidase domain